MDLYFCDICNESVPQLDLDGGSARRINGRVICKTCELAMSHADDGPGPDTAGAAARPSEMPESPFAHPVPPARPPVAAPPSPPHHAPELHHPPAPARGGVGGLLVVGIMAAAALAVSFAATVVLVDRIQDSRRLQTQELARVESRQDARWDELRGQIERRDEDQRSTLTSELESLGAESRTRASEQGARLARIEDRLGELAALSQRIGSLEGDAKERRDEAGRLSAELAQVQRDVGVLAERWMESVAAGDVVEPKAESDVEDVPGWLEFTAGLSSPSAATRWSSVTALGDAGDERVVPYLIGMLEDPDIFVRMATARILEELASMDAVPALIDALDDEEGVVREAVVTALRKITGQNHRFDPMGNEAERARRIKAWRDWWKKQNA